MRSAVAATETWPLSAWKPVPLLRSPVRWTSINSIPPLKANAPMAPDLLTFERLIHDFGSLPVKKATRTFMQVAGYPHYENVCSNILAFYLDPREEHGLADLVLRAFMTCLEITREGPIIDADIQREVMTEQGGRLDLLIRTDDFVIGIENKIWAWLHNDLSDYANLVASRAKTTEGAKPYHAVLTLLPLASVDLAHARNAGFCNITYEQIILEARNLLGHYASAANAKFLTYFTDFMQTIESLKGSKTDAVRTAFFVKHGKQIEELANTYWTFRNGKIPVLMGLVEPLPKEVCKQWVYQKTTLVHSINGLGEHADKTMSVDTRYDTTEWNIVIFSRTAQGGHKTTDCIAYLNEILPLLSPNVYQDFHLNVDASQATRIFPAETTELEIARILNPLLRDLVTKMGHPAG